MVESLLERNYPREEYVYLAKLYEKAEKYDEMIKIVSLFVAKNPLLNSEERILLTSCFKKAIARRRSSISFIKRLEEQEKKSNLKFSKYLNELRLKDESEIRKIAEEILHLLKTFLLDTKENDLESTIFYLKLKGDYHRYLAEIYVESEQEREIDNSEQTYLNALELARELQNTHPLKLGCSLNLAVLYYEQRNNREEACRVAKQALDDSVKMIEELERNSKSKESYTLLQVLKENYYIWSNDYFEDQNFK
jgi:hypothetical protein